MADILDVLREIRSIAEKHNLSTPYIVGGVPRDRLMSKLYGKRKPVDDVDITTGDSGSIILAKKIEEKNKDINYREYDDGHVSIDFRGIHFDFSNNFLVPGIKDILIKRGVEPTDMNMEIYSRDFTINCLLEDLSLESVYDITGLGEDDIKSKVLRCPIDPNATIKSDPKRIFRALKFALKFDMIIDDSLKAAIMGNRELVKTMSTSSVQKKINEIVYIDPDKGIDLLIEYKLLPLVPLTKMVSDILIQKRKLVRAL